jgi:hypothetical protein
MLPLRNQRCVLIILAAVLLPDCAPGQAAEDDREPAGAVVYSNDFANAAGAEWSTQKTGLTPKGNRKFLGPFANDRVSLTLKDLPDHAYVRVSFELFVMMTWDGGDLRDPDIWSLRLKGGPKLIHCTFATARGEQGAQTFPDNLPGPMHPGRTGAAEELTLGYVWRETPLDAVYRLRPVFPHKGKELTLVFSGSALQEVSDESWGLANVRVELFPGPQPLDQQKLRVYWQALVGSDPPKAFEALWRLVLAGDQAAELAARDEGGPQVKEATVRRLIAQMDSDKWQEREEATRKLRDMGSSVSAILTEALERQGSPEVRTRIRRVLAELAGQRYGLGQVRWLRLIRLMQLSGSPKAASVLAKLARGGPTEEVRCLAAAAARRVAAKASPGWIDLLRRVDPHTRRTNGEWTAGNSCLFASPVQRAKLALPVAPRGDYELVAEFMRLQGTGEVNFILPVGRTGAMVSLDDHDGKSYLQNINGREDTPFGAAALAIGRKQRLRVVVRRKAERAAILAELNGQQIGRWEGPLRSLSPQPAWSVAPSDVLGLGVRESILAFFRLDLRMLSGKAKAVHVSQPLGPFPPRPVAPARSRDIRR